MAKQPTSQSGSNGRLTYGPNPEDGLVPKTLEFVYSRLPEWRDDPRRSPDSSEKKLNSSLCDFLDHRSRFDCPMVRFKHEAPQVKTRTVDIGVHGVANTTLVGSYSYSIYEPFLVIEAKRLPAPSTDRECEYVTGKDKDSGSATGGIQRFKLGLHGATNETAVIVGYVQKHSIEHWIKTVNNWIASLAGETSDDGCVWAETEKLGDPECDETQQTGRVESAHQRTGPGLTAIRLHHLWVVMTPLTVTV